MNKAFLKASVLYVLSIVAIVGLMWLVLGVALPDARENVIRVLATVFNLQLPDNFFAQNSGFKIFSVPAAISLFSVGLIIINVYFGAVVTSDLIRPKVKLLTSSRGVLSTKWNAEMPHILVRMSNFHAADLVDVKLTAVLTVEEMREGGEAFICYLPVKDFTPPHVIVMAQRLPWTIAVPADTHLSTSLVKDYHFKPGTPIEHSFSKGKKIVRVKRTLEIMLQGTDTKSYSSFVIHRKILIDEQEGAQYTLHLHKGSFKSLPLQIASAAELEQYVD